MKSFEQCAEIYLAMCVMPGIGPDRLHREVSALFPDKVLFISGYSSEFVSKLGTEAGELLQKPFSPGELVSKVRQILDQAAHVTSGEKCSTKLRPRELQRIQRLGPVGPGELAFPSAADEGTSLRE